jgi:serine acetyltransferase
MPGYPIRCHLLRIAGHRIGTGSVVCAGAVVINDVPDFTVVGGVPAKAIKKIDASDRKTGDGTKQFPNDIGI